MANKGTYWVFQDHFRFLSRPLPKSCKLNICGSIWCISHQNKCQPLNFKFLNLLCPSRSIVAIYEQIWPGVKNTQKSSNSHNRSSNPLKLTPEITTIGTHIVSKCQLCTPSISKFITKRVLINFFQDHLILRPLYTNLGQN